MWGNAQGWFISLVLLGMLMFGMHKLGDIALISDPTSFGKDEANLATVSLPTPPSKLVAMDQGVDAKALYRAAIEDYRKNGDDYERFSKSKTGTDAEKLAGLQNLLDATHASNAVIFADAPEQLINYHDKPELDALA